MFRPSMLAIFRLYMKHLTISYIYMRMWSLHFVGWGGYEISFCYCRRGMDRVCLGGVVKISFMSTNSYVFKQVNFFIFAILYWKTILSWTTSKVLWSSIHSFLHILDYFFTIFTILYHMRWMLCTVIIIYDLMLKAWPTCNTVLLNGWLAIEYYCRWELVQRSPVNFRYTGTVACWGQVSACELLQGEI